MQKLSNRKMLYLNGIENKKHKYCLIISYKENGKKAFETKYLFSREYDIANKSKELFYKIVKEKSGMILHNIQKPFEQDTHLLKRKKGLFTDSKTWLHNQNINSFEYTYCIV